MDKTSTLTFTTDEISVLFFAVCEDESRFMSMVESGEEPNPELVKIVSAQLTMVRALQKKLAQAKREAK
jgi:hypothetical protein